MFWSLYELRIVLLIDGETILSEKERITTFSPEDQVEFFTNYFNLMVRLSNKQKMGRWLRLNKVVKTIADDNKYAAQCCKNIIIDRFECPWDFDSIIWLLKILCFIDRGDHKDFFKMIIERSLDNYRGSQVLPRYDLVTFLLKIAGQVSDYRKGLITILLGKLISKGNHSSFVRVIGGDCLSNEIFTTQEIDAFLVDMIKLEVEYDLGQANIELINLINQKETKAKQVCLLLEKAIKTNDEDFFRSALNLYDKEKKDEIVKIMLEKAIKMNKLHMGTKIIYLLPKNQRLGNFLQILTLISKEYAYDLIRIITARQKENILLEPKTLPFLALRCVHTELISQYAEINMCDNETSKVTIIGLILKEYRTIHALIKI